MVVVRAASTSAATETVTPVATSASASASKVVSYAEEMPFFTGGSEAMHHYLASKLIYPAEAIKHSLSGTVVVQFTVDELGRVGEVDVVRTSDPVFDMEAKRVMYTMPWWMPGREQGQPVRVRCTMPIIFTFKRGN